MRPASYQTRKRPARPLTGNLRNRKLLHLCFAPNLLQKCVDFAPHLLQDFVNLVGIYYKNARFLPRIYYKIVILTFFFGKNLHVPKISATFAAEIKSNMI